MTRTLTHLTLSDDCEATMSRPAVEDWRHGLPQYGLTIREERGWELGLAVGCHYMVSWPICGVFLQEFILMGIDAPDGRGVVFHLASLETF